MSEESVPGGGAPAVPKTDLLDWILFVPFVLAFSLTMMLLDVFQRIGYAIGPKAIHAANVYFNYGLRYVFRIVGLREQISYAEPIEPGPPYLVISNHQSLYDVILMQTELAACQPRFIAKKELAKYLPGVSFNLRNAGHGVIDRASSSQSLKVMLHLAKEAKAHGHAVVLFPEGTRARDGVLKEYHAAGVAAFLKCAPDARIIPVTIDGSWKIQSHRRGPVPRGVKVTVVFGKSLDPAQFGRDAEKICAAVREQTVQTLEKIRSHSG